MRQIVLDTETTGLDPKNGDRMIEIGCIELVERRPSGRKFHEYLNPGREVPHRATAVHGLTRADLQDKPRFSSIAGQLLEFLDGAELVIHNAPFDMGFLKSELQLAGMEPDWLDQRCRVFDTLPLARRKHPGLRNSLDALCHRYNIDASHRTLHGALPDAALLVQVYLALTNE